jgi:hypothetical protein
MNLFDFVLIYISMSNIVYAMDEYWDINSSVDPPLMTSYRRDGRYKIQSHRMSLGYEVVVFGCYNTDDPSIGIGICSIETSIQSYNVSCWVRDTVQLLQLYASDPLV